jgi:hypothetical protein
MVVGIKSDQIEKFWDWFVEIEQTLQEDFEQEPLIKEISRKVRELGNFGWEIGPGIKKPYLFVISPNGNPELLEGTKEVISYAPKILSLHWEFYPAKPPKVWQDFKFMIKNSEGSYLDINANNWEYVLLKFSDGTFDIILKAPQIANFKEREKFVAAEVLLIGLLGEEKFISKVVDIEVVKDFEEKYKGSSTPIKDFKAHFKELT